MTYLSLNIAVVSLFVKNFAINRYSDLMKCLLTLMKNYFFKHIFLIPSGAFPDLRRF